MDKNLFLTLADEICILLEANLSPEKINPHLFQSQSKSGQESAIPYSSLLHGEWQQKEGVWTSTLQQEGIIYIQYLIILTIVFFAAFLGGLEDWRLD